MAKNANDEVQLSRKHEEILWKRSALQQHMEVWYERQTHRKEQQAAMSQAAQERNTKLLQDFQEVENRIQTRPLLHPDVLNLQTRYWASVERRLPEWELNLLGKGMAPSPELQRHKHPQLDVPPARNRGKSLRPKP